MVSMPVIVIGADTPVGEATIKAVVAAAAEVRAFISDEERADDLKAQGVKVALGDVSDFSHVEAAALNCFCAILVAEAAADGRERAFAVTQQEVWAGWATAVRNAGLHRTIWVDTEGTGTGLPRPTPEVAIVVHADVEKAAAVVADLEGLQSIPD